MNPVSKLDRYPILKPEDLFAKLANFLHSTSVTPISGSRVQEVHSYQHSQGTFSVYETTLRDLLRYGNISTRDGEFTNSDRRGCRVSRQHLGDREHGGGPSESTGIGVASSGAGRRRKASAPLCDPQFLTWGIRLTPKVCTR